MRSSRGFTLIEMAIVLVVLTLIISGGLFAVAGITDNTKRAETNKKLDVIEKALVLYAIQNACLPCPADGNLASSNADAGRARYNASTYYSTGCTSVAGDDCDGIVGVVPWRNLGLSEMDIVDAWGTRITYSIAQDSGIEDTDGMVRIPPSTYTPLGEVVVQTAASTPVNITSVAAYVLVSHGKDRAFGRAGQTGTLQNDTHSSATNDPQPENGDGDVTFTMDDLNEVANADYFDDIVRFRTKPFVIQMCGANACGNPE